MEINIKNILRQTALALLLLAWLFLTPALSMMIKLPLQQLTLAADIIVLGDVEDVRCEWSLNKEIILTVTTVRVKEIWKGEVQKSRVFIQTPGGTIGDLTLKVSDVSVFQKGENVLVFLKTIENVKHLQNSFSVSANYLPSFSVFGKAQGKYSIDRNKIARKSGYSILKKDMENQDVEEDNVLALSELEARIKVMIKNDLRKNQKKHEIIR